MELYLEFCHLIEHLRDSFGYSPQDAIVEAAVVWLPYFPETEREVRMLVQRQGWDAAASLQRRIG